MYYKYYNNYYILLFRVLSVLFLVFNLSLFSVIKCSEIKNYEVSLKFFYFKYAKNFLRLDYIIIRHQSQLLGNSRNLRTVFYSISPVVFKLICHEVPVRLRSNSLMQRHVRKLNINIL